MTISRKTITYDERFAKAAVLEDQGIVTAYTSIFGNVDLQSDKVMPGAFSKSLKQWRASGDPIPAIWSHDWFEPMHYIGRVTDAREDANGLQVDMQFDMDNPMARQIFKLIKDRLVKEWSFAYDVLDERPGDDGSTELHELSLIEIGPTLKGANPATSTVGVKNTTSSTNYTGGLTWAPEADPKADPRYWSKQLDRLDPVRKTVKKTGEPDLVEVFLAEERERRAAEAQARAEQAAWEKRMLINTVLDPVPVRVDARMRPNR